MNAIKTNKQPWEIFSKRIRSASAAKLILPFKAVDTPLETCNRLLNQKPAANGRVIYVHIPFCENNCTFCFYNKCSVSDILRIKEYCHTLTEQIKETGTKPWVKELPFTAVYFGGGTPTSIESFYLIKILNAIRQHLPLSPDCEITVESTIAGITPELINKLKKAGVNRISLGVQTFDDNLRKSIGRKSDRVKINETVNFISSEGISNICIDLIYNFRNQNIELWKNDLGYLSNLPVTACSIYPLISKNSGENSEKEFAYYREACETLVGINKWEQFTPVQFGNKNGEAHYVKSQGESADVLAFGAGAGGRINNYMYFHHSDVNHYDKRRMAFNKNLTWMKISPAFMKLRKIFAISEGLSVSRIEIAKIYPSFREDIEHLIEIGLINETSENFELTLNGKYWAGNISAMFAERIKQVIDK